MLPLPSTGAAPQKEIDKQRRKTNNKKKSKEKEAPTNKQAHLHNIAPECDAGGSTIASMATPIKKKAKTGTHIKKNKAMNHDHVQKELTMDMDAEEQDAGAVLQDDAGDKSSSAISTVRNRRAKQQADRDNIQRALRAAQQHKLDDDDDDLDFSDEECDDSHGKSGSMIDDEASELSNEENEENEEEGELSNEENEENGEDGDMPDDGAFDGSDDESEKPADNIPKPADKIPSIEKLLAEKQREDARKEAFQQELNDLYGPAQPAAESDTGPAVVSEATVATGEYIVPTQQAGESDIGPAAVSEATVATGEHMVIYNPGDMVCISAANKSRSSTYSYYITFDST